MRRLLFVCGLLVGVLLLVSAPQVRADDLDTFTFSESLNGVDTQSIVWQLPASPDPGVNFVVGLGFGLVAVPTSTYVDDFFQTSQTNNFLFFNNLIGGGFLSDTFSLTGVCQLYTGTEDAPTFTPGTYSGFDTTNNEAATLTIAAPEPSSLLLLFAGFLALAGALALKKVQV